MKWRLNWLKLTENRGFIIGMFFVDNTDFLENVRAMKS